MTLHYDFCRSVQFAWPCGSSGVYVELRLPKDIIFWCDGKGLMSVDDNYCGTPCLVLWRSYCEEFILTRMGVAGLRSTRDFLLRKFPGSQSSRVLIGWPCSIASQGMDKSNKVPEEQEKGHIVHIQVDRIVGVIHVEVRIRTTCLIIKSTCRFYIWRCALILPSSCPNFLSLNGTYKK